MLFFICTLHCTFQENEEEKYRGSSGGGYEAHPRVDNTRTVSFGRFHNRIKSRAAMQSSFFLVCLLLLLGNLAHARTPKTGNHVLKRKKRKSQPPPTTNGKRICFTDGEASSTEKTWEFHPSIPRNVAGVDSDLKPRFNLKPYLIIEGDYMRTGGVHEFNRDKGVYRYNCGGGPDKATGLCKDRWRCVDNEDDCSNYRRSVHGKLDNGNGITATIWCDWDQGKFLYTVEPRIYKRRRLLSRIHGGKSPRRRRLLVSGRGLSGNCRL